MTDVYEYLLSHRVSRPGLARIRELLKLLKKPENALKIVHVAGTNGKGSVCAMLESIICCAGFKTGLFCSPALCSPCDGIRVGKCAISEDELGEVLADIAEAEKNMTEPPTEFEILTAAALLYFKQRGCSVVILETGMGGAQDATNAVENPILSVITDISIDHTEFLGATVAKIAHEKAGIIKDGVPVIFGGSGEAEGIIRSRARGSAYIPVQYDKLSNVKYSLRGSSFDFDNYSGLKLSLGGVYQPQNAARALTAIAQLIRLGFEITDGAVRAGLETVSWPGRFELLCEEPVMIYDGAHNLQGMKAAALSIEEIFGGKVNILMGVMADKEHKAMCEIIAPLVNEAFTVTPNNPRALDSKELAVELSALGVRAQGFDSIKCALRTAAESSKDMPLLILGSLYLYADIKAELVNVMQRQRLQN